MMADRQDSLRWLAEQTGGFAIVNQNDINRRHRPDRGRHAGLLPDWLRHGPGAGRAAGSADVKITTLRPGLQSGRDVAAWSGQPRRRSAAAAR